MKHLPIYLRDHNASPLGAHSMSEQIPSPSKGKAEIAEEIFIRAHTAPIEKPVPDKTPQRTRSDRPKWAKWALCFDTETRIDLRQELTFGVYRICQLVNDSYRLYEEGIFYADSLPANERKVLENYVYTHASDATGLPSQSYNWWRQATFEHD